MAVLHDFIDHLAQTPTTADAFNEYGAANPLNALRRANLLRYLQTMMQRQIHWMLVMEAPGYRGCRLTGVPVTSRKILLEGLPELSLFGREQGYHIPDDPGFEKVSGEQSATIVWDTLRSLKVVPLIWNAFPFHPHQPGKPLSNRKPRQSELRIGADFLREMIHLAQPGKIVAVGNVAESSLRGLGLECVRVRHPAQGGKNDFVRGLHDLMTKDA